MPVGITPSVNPSRHAAIASFFVLTPTPLPNILAVSDFCGAEPSAVVYQADVEKNADGCKYCGRLTRLLGSDDANCWLRNPGVSSAATRARRAKIALQCLQG